MIAPVPGHSIPFANDIAAIFHSNLLRSLVTHSPIPRTGFLISINVLLSALLPMLLTQSYFAILLASASARCLYAGCCLSDVVLLSDFM